EAKVVLPASDDVGDARERWFAASARDRADLGVARAADLAARHAAGYAHARPPHNVLADLRDAWGEQAEQQRRLDHNRTLRERLAEVIALRAQRDQALAAPDTRQEQARAVAEQARAQADRSAAAIERHAQQIRDQLLHQWNEQLEQAGDAARVVLAGPGRIGLRLVAVRRATETLASWSTEWQPYLPDMPTSTDRIAHYATWPPNQQRITEAFDR